VPLAGDGGAPGKMYFFMDNTTGAAAISESSAGVVTFLRAFRIDRRRRSISPRRSRIACEAVACGNGRSRRDRRLRTTATTTMVTAAAARAGRNGIAVARAGSRGGNSRRRRSGRRRRRRRGRHLWTKTDSCQKRRFAIHAIRNAASTTARSRRATRASRRWSVDRKSAARLVEMHSRRRLLVDDDCPRFGRRAMRPRSLQPAP